ncbi:hypothetical protein ACTFIY_003585 [Dictyostelium cf. discoideum]
MTDKEQLNNNVQFQQLSTEMKEAIKSIMVSPTEQEIEDKKNGKRKRKVPLPHGHSQLDWMKKQSVAQPCFDTSGNGGKITIQELKKHNNENDAWTVYKGRVYNITDYFQFHPGGKIELLRAAGNDCTQMFEFTHSWVNFEAMMLKYLVGYLSIEDN